MSCLVDVPPQGNVIPQATKVVLYSIRGGFRLDAAKPSFQLQKHGKKVDWDETFVSEIRKGLRACTVLYV